MCSIIKINIMAEEKNKLVEIFLGDGFYLRQGSKYPDLYQLVDRDVPTRVLVIPITEEKTDIEKVVEYQTILGIKKASPEEKVSSLIKKALSREDQDLIDEAVESVISNFERITGVDPVTTIDPDDKLGSFNMDVIDKTVEPIKKHVFKVFENFTAKLWDEFLYKLDDRLLEKFADEAVKKYKRSYIEKINNNSNSNIINRRIVNIRRVLSKRNDLSLSNKVTQEGHENQFEISNKARRLQLTERLTIKANSNGLIYCGIYMIEPDTTKILQYSDKKESLQKGGLLDKIETIEIQNQALGREFFKSKGFEFDIIERI